ncbi:hypothetical protein OF83DRAFT_1171968 [Amylostereum chailletii]|nr:hypothetical protein OF83DRAFT_1171968 [Amylostereum chailletii]
MLNGTGLLAAIVTAVIVESYQGLSSDPADVTVALVTQLVALANGIQPLPAPPASFSFGAPSSSICPNILWTARLILGLACTLGTTLAQQWPLLVPPASSSSSAPTSSVRINILWIAKFVISLACALDTTLVKPRREFEDYIKYCDRLCLKIDTTSLKSSTHDSPSQNSGI